MNRKRFEYRFADDGRSIAGRDTNHEEIARQYQVNDEPGAKSLGAVLEPLYADLVDVSVAVYMADRISLRSANPDEWRREITLRLPVRCVNQWRRPEALEALEAYLTFLTQEKYEFDFFERQADGRASERQQFLPLAAKGAPLSVSLFSGGLDSYAGTAAWIAANREQHFVCVSNSPNRRQEAHQKRQLATLKDSLRPLSLTGVRIQTTLSDSVETRQEQTRRTRGFLFLSLGAAAALTIDCHRLLVFENGVGAINLPYERVPAGVPNSRAVHPRSLLLFARLIRVLTESEFSVDNPCAYLTKAEMCLHSSVQALRGSVSDSFSCDGFPVRRRQTPQCGVCTSCILRRLALFNAGLGDTDSSSYCLDLLASAETVNPPRLRGLHAMDWQVERLEHALGQQADWEGLVIEFPEIREACAALMTVRNESELVTIPQLGRLFSKHCSEWESFPVQRWIRRFSEAA